MNSKLTLSRVALGFWRWKEWNISISQLETLVGEALNVGITTFDHANIYDEGNPESAFGQVLSKTPSLREKIQLITKSTIVYPGKGVQVKYYDSSYDHIIGEVENSLRRLQTDYSDLHLLHRPDPLMDPAEVARAFNDLQAAGKVLNFGVSNYTPAYFELLQSYLGQPLVTNQIEASVLQHDNFDNGTIANAMQHHISPIIWSPLAGGKIFFGDDEKSLRVQKELKRVGEEIGTDRIDDVAFAWLYTHPANMIPITGSCEMEYVRRPIEALQYRLSREQWFAIWSAYTGVRVP